MGAFIVVLDESASPAFARRVRKLYPQSYQYTDKVFFVEANNIPEIIARRLKIKVGEGREEARMATGAVFGLDGSYSGWTAKALWDWLRMVEK